MNNQTTIAEQIANREINYLKEDYTKVLTRWVLKDSRTSNEGKEYKRKSLDKGTIKWFRNLGSKETTKQGRKHGYGCTIHTSISPDGQDKSVRYFFY